MVSFNRVVLAGNLTRDPELRFTQQGVPVASFSIAVNRVRSKSEEVDFFNVSAWRELGETVANYVQFLSRSGDPQAHAEAPASANKAPAETAAVGGWGVARQQAEGNGTESKEEEDLKEEDFDDLPF